MWTDIQGTGSVTLAGILSAMKNQGKAPEMLREERILVSQPATLPTLTAPSSH